MTIVPHQLGLISDELEARNAELAEAQRIAKLGFWRWETGSGNFAWSDEIYRLLGLEPATFEVTVESTFECIHLADREATMSKLVATVADKQPQTHEYRAHHLDGRVLHFWSSTTPVLDADGTVVEVRGICQDITDRVIAQVALRESEDHYRHAVELSPQIPWTADADGNIIEIGPRWCELIGMTEEESLGRGWSRALHPEDVESALAAWNAALTSGEKLDIEYRIRRLDGQYNWLRVRAAPRKDRNGCITRWYGTAEDIQAQKDAEYARLESDGRLAAVLESTGDCVVVVDRNWRVTYRNQKALTAAGAPESLPIGANLWMSLPVPADGEFRSRLEASFETGTPAEFETFVPGPNVWFEVLADPNETMLSIFFRDITEVRQARERITYLAHHDSLTGLPNRAHFLERLAAELEAATVNDQSVAVIYLDLDGFKDINDTLGHDAGDAALSAVAKRLEGIVPGNVARIGGDEFAILQSGNINKPALEALTSKLKDCLAPPVYHGSVELSCKASFGIAMYPQSDHRPSELTKNADLALYEAKRAGGNKLEFFNPEVRQRVQHRISALACARDALSRGAIFPFYQPKVSLKTGKLDGFEALLRWSFPGQGVQSPALIKEAFDDPLLSVELGKRMLQHVVKDMQAWSAKGVNFGTVSINASAQEFLRTDFAGNVLSALLAANLATTLFEVEVTESVFLEDESSTVARSLDRLRSHGVNISLDDFGTGYASLTHLREFPVSCVKIDQSFVKNLGDDSGATAIVKAVIGLARDLEIKVVAEGVETTEQLDFLSHCGCDVAQGYILAKPMSADRVPYFVQKLADRLPPPETTVSQLSERLAEGEPDFEAARMRWLA